MEEFKLQISKENKKLNQEIANEISFQQNQKRRIQKLNQIELKLK